MIGDLIWKGRDRNGKKFGYRDYIRVERPLSGFEDVYMVTGFTILGGIKVRRVQPGTLGLHEVLPRKAWRCYEKIEPTSIDFFAALAGIDPKLLCRKVDANG